MVDTLLERKMLGKEAVLVEGAKWCGKTTTSSRLAKSILKTRRDECAALKQTIGRYESRIVASWRNSPAYR